jgi:hypothetical protein
MRRTGDFLAALCTKDWRGSLGLVACCFVLAFLVCPSLRAEETSPKSAPARPGPLFREPQSAAQDQQDRREGAERQGNATEQQKPTGSVTFIDRRRYLELLRQSAVKEGVPSDLAEAVTQVESGFHPEMIGTGGEIGLMQVRPGTAAMLGFQGTPDQLAVPEINIRYGVAYLAQAWRLAGGEICRALMKYRAGHGEQRMTLRSEEYCLRAKSYLSKMNSNLASNFTSQDLAPPAHADAPPVPPARAKLVSNRPPKFRNSKEFWAWKAAQISELTKKVHRKWARIARMRSASR